jgi:hypothetical protein
MASQKQIEANRRNARKSTGPRSVAAKKRASRNAYSHGLSRPMFGAEFARAVEALASRILDDHAKTGDQHALAVARRIAQAELELARVQRIKVALIERAHNLGWLEPRKLFRTKKDEAAWAAQHFLGATLGNIRPKCAIETLPPMPEDEPQRTAEAVRRVLPDLLRLSRYERRAAARRDRAICRLMQSEDAICSSKCSDLAKRTQFLFAVRATY